jgi:hypothetical protein
MTTDDQGRFRFGAIPVGTYRVEVIDPPAAAFFDPHSPAPEQLATVAANDSVAADFMFERLVLEPIAVRFGEVGQSCAFDLSAEGEAGTRRAVSGSWSVSSDAVAVVTLGGLVTAVGDGEATLSVSAGNQTLAASVAVTTGSGTSDCPVPTISAA